MEARMISRNTSPEQRRRARERQRKAVRQRKIIIGILELLVFILLVLLLCLFFQTHKVTKEDTAVIPVTVEAFGTGVVTKVQGIQSDIFIKHPGWEENYLTVNENSRSGDPLNEVNSIFVHYTANPGTSARQNRSYFEQLKDTNETSASAHFIIGYEGEIIQCIPLDEIAYAVKGRNEDSISIECCYLAKDGSFTRETYDSLLLLLDWLMDAYDLNADDILRHYDCGGKQCPVYYVENEDAWAQLKEDAAAGSR